MKEVIGGYLEGQFNRFITFAGQGWRQVRETMEQGASATPFSGAIDVKHGLEPQPKPSSEKSEA